MNIEQRLPNFFLIGANKAGTTSLNYYLMQHPDIFMSANKEPMFFLPIDPSHLETEGKSLDLSFTLTEYLRLFESTSAPFRGEASTAYLSTPSAMLWIRKIVPHAKLIAVLRNPIERAVSDYLYHFKAGIEKRSFETAIMEALEWTPPPHENKSSRAGKKHPLGDPNRNIRRYLRLGLYGSHLSNIKLYFPNEQIHVIDFEALNSDGLNTVNKVFQFLGADQFVPYSMERQNVSDKGGFTFSLSVRERLKEYFKEDINLLQSLVNFDVIKWLE